MRKHFAPLDLKTFTYLVPLHCVPSLKLTMKWRICNKTKTARVNPKTFRYLSPLQCVRSVCDEANRYETKGLMKGTSDLVTYNPSVWKNIEHRAIEQSAESLGHQIETKYPAAMFNCTPRQWVMTRTPMAKVDPRTFRYLSPEECVLLVSYEAEKVEIKQLLKGTIMPFPIKKGEVPRIELSIWNPVFASIEKQHRENAQFCRNIVTKIAADSVEMAWFGDTKRLSKSIKRMKRAELRQLKGKYVSRWVGIKTDIHGDKCRRIYLNGEMLFNDLRKMELDGSCFDDVYKTTFYRKTENPKLKIKSALEQPDDWSHQATVGCSNAKQIECLPIRDEDKGSI